MYFTLPFCKVLPSKRWCRQFLFWGGGITYPWKSKTIKIRVPKFGGLKFFTWTMIFGENPTFLMVFGLPGTKVQPRNTHFTLRFCKVLPSKMVRSFFFLVFALKGAWWIDGITWTRSLCCLLRRKHAMWSKPSARRGFWKSRHEPGDVFDTHGAWPRPWALWCESPEAEFCRNPEVLKGRNKKRSEWMLVFSGYCMLFWGYIYFFLCLVDKKRHHLSLKKHKMDIFASSKSPGELGWFPRLELVLDELQLSDSEVLPLRNETCLGTTTASKKPQLTYTPKWNAKRKKKGGKLDVWKLIALISMGIRIARSFSVLFFCWRLCLTAIKKYASQGLDQKNLKTNLPWFCWQNWFFLTQVPFIWIPSTKKAVFLRGRTIFVASYVAVSQEVPRFNQTKL